MAVVEKLSEAKEGDTVPMLCHSSEECTGRQRLVKLLSHSDDFIVSPAERRFTAKCHGCHGLSTIALPPEAAS